MAGSGWSTGAPTVQSAPDYSFHRTGSDLTYGGGAGITGATSAPASNTSGYKYRTPTTWLDLVWLGVVWSFL